jgi:hypothetical protein
LHDAAPSAHAPGRDGRLREPGPRHPNVLERCRFLRWIRRKRTTACAPHRTSTPRGVNDPHREGPRAAPASRYRGRSRPAFCPPPGRAPGGRHTAPSDLDDQDADNLLSLSVFGPPRWREVRAHWRRQRAWRFECSGTSSVPALVPRLAGFPSQPGEEAAALSPARDSIDSRACGRCGKCDRTEMRRRVDVRLRRRRPGGRGAGIASG